eukprot:TRINITY_DN1720_c0_g1_i3.p1 TRINITY_DN1720_c0_g1~~TRINITY_DN1720_c0_g1_i3.p1  ORF type:complete len:104 (-),score=8.85 TRINITY_DN1720_c0_g1_i3:85-396(-)
MAYKEVVIYYTSLGDRDGLSSLEGIFKRAGVPVAETVNITAPEYEAKKAGIIEKIKKARGGSVVGYPHVFADDEYVGDHKQIAELGESLHEGAENFRAHFLRR